jgi:release factor glutamine methyltransferase
MSRSVGAALAVGKAALQKAEIISAGLDARLLLQAAVGLSHEAIVADPDVEISDAALTLFQSYLARRLEHEPVSRILGHREFYGRDFMISRDVLDPRPDTETLIDLALGFLTESKALRMLDLGTGSGAIALTLLAERNFLDGVGTDVSASALTVATANAKALGVATRFHPLVSDWFSGVAGTFDLIVSNPPYIPADAIAGLAADVRNFDPHLALVGGADGLAPYGLIAQSVAAHLAPGGTVIVEFGAGQGRAVAAIFAAAGFSDVASGTDLGGHLRCLAFQRG